MTSAWPLPQRGLYAITDCRNLTTTQLLHKTEQILAGGAVILQYRNKNTDHSLKLSQAGLLQNLCAQYGIPFIVNDDPALARMLAADGVHLGRDDMTCSEAREFLGPGIIIGISCYNEPHQAEDAAASGATYIALGAFYPSRTKPGAVRAQTGMIGAVKKSLRVPVVAIGGITPENGGVLIDAGADFLAVSSGLYAPEDTGLAVLNYHALFKR